jgi:hypothetical protein
MPIIHSLAARFRATEEPRMKSLAVRVLAGTFLAVATVAWTGAGAIENDEIGVLRLFDEFVSSGAAASQCAQPDDLSAARFLSNFQWVSTHAHLEIGRQLPGSGAEVISAELARRSKEVKDRTHALVRAEGCEAGQVQDLVKRFAIQAAWVREG